MIRRFGVNSKGWQSYEIPILRLGWIKKYPPRSFFRSPLSCLMPGDRSSLFILKLSTPPMYVFACVRISLRAALLKLTLQALIALLTVRFEDMGDRKIEKGQFALEDTRRKQGLDLAKPWTTLIKPGQHISMSMIFRRQQISTGRCPSCAEENEDLENDDVEWWVKNQHRYKFNN